MVTGGRSSSLAAQHWSPAGTPDTGGHVKLSIFMAAYNEANTVATAIKQVLSVDFPCETELIVVDDGSTDGTREIIADLDEDRLVTRMHPSNRGKGAAVRTALGNASGDYAVIFDADLEYFADDLILMLRPISAGDAQIVFGSRTFGGASAHSFTYVMGNKVTTFAANAMFNSWINDLHCCLKLAPVALLRDLDIQANGFGVDTEITAKLLQRGMRPFEVPVRYRARTHADGKKITWRDGVDALRILARTRAQGLHRVD